MAKAETELNLDELANTPEGMKQLREAYERAQRERAEEAKQRAELARANMFLTAGIASKYDDPKTERIAAMLRQTFQGEDVTALVDEARDLGLLAAPAGATGAPATKIDTFDTASTSMASGVGAGGGPSDTPHPVDAAFNRFTAEVAKGTPREEAAGLVWAGMLGAAKAGDTRVIFDEQAWLADAHPYDPHNVAGSR